MRKTVKNKQPYAVMRPLADGLVERMRPACERIEIGGSLRRECALIGDIEIVAVPRFRQISMFDMGGQASLLDELIENWPVQLLANGPRMKKFLLTTKNGLSVQVDLFVQPDPATWGVNFLLRTGNDVFSHKMVTKRSEEGYMPDHLRVKGARVWDGDKVLDTPEEEDIFRLWGMYFVPPVERDL